MFFYRDGFQKVEIAEDFSSVVDVQYQEDGKFWLSLQTRDPNNSLCSLLLLLDSDGQLLNKWLLPETPPLFPFDKFQPGQSTWYTRNWLQQLKTFYVVDRSGSLEFSPLNDLLTQHPGTKIISLIQTTSPVEDLYLIARQHNLSPRQLTRRLKQLTGLTPNLYLRELRLQVAKDLLYDRQYKTVKEVSYAVGFKDTRYFSSLFKKRFGSTPSDLLT